MKNEESLKYYIIYHWIQLFQTTRKEYYPTEYGIYNT